MSPQAPGVTEFHSGILVADLGHAASSQPSPVSRLFSSSTVQDALVKGEQVPLHGGSPQVPAVGSSECHCGWDGWDFLSEMSQLTPGLGGHLWGAPGLSLGLQAEQRGLKPAHGSGRDSARRRAGRSTGAGEEQGLPCEQPGARRNSAPNLPQEAWL